MRPLPYILAMVLLLTICEINAKPQHPKQPLLATPGVQRVADEMFTTQVTSTTTPRTEIKVDNNQQCKCVPYHMCNDTIRGTDEKGFGHIDIGIAPSKCPNVQHVCCIDVKLRGEQILPVMPKSASTRAAGCGIRNVGGLGSQIVGALDNEAGFGEFPWTVALLRVESGQLLCGGSLIHPKAILTANHCVKDYVNKTDELIVRAGEWDTQTTKERLPYQERQASRICSHPSYGEGNLHNDVAVIELKEPFKLDDHIATVCLPPLGLVPDSPKCFVSGWGKDESGKAGKHSVIMKKVPLPIVSFWQCETALRGTRLGERFRLDTSFICAGGEAGIDTCRGDGGAPLVCPVGRPDQNRYTQIGITAWGIGCMESIPGVYANVASAREWIDGQMQSIGLDTSYYTSPN